MEEQSPEETGPDLMSEDLNTVEETDIINSDDLIKHDDESGSVDVEGNDAEQEAALEVNIQNTAEKPEEEIGASVRDDASYASHDSEDRAASDVEREEGELESQEEEDSRQSPDLQLDSDENQELLRELQAEHETLSELNHQLQTKLAECFRLKSGEDVQSNQEVCQKYPHILEDIKRQWEDKKQKQLQQHYVDDLLQQNNDKLEQIELEWNTLISSQREVLIADLEQAKGKMSAQAVAERLLGTAQKCEDEFVSVRKETFKLNRKMAELGSGLHVSEQGLDGELNHIDFEQLNIENQTFSEKIQECKEDLLKLKRMLPQTSQILMHVKEKLRFVQVENQEQQVRFDELDTMVLREQQALTQTMQARDKLRFDNLRIRQDGGLLGRAALLRDLEDTEDKREALERQVEMLQRS